MSAAALREAAVGECSRGAIDTAPLRAALRSSQRAGRRGKPRERLRPNRRLGRTAQARVRGRPAEKGFRPAYSYLS
jgi:hypothetical protein